MSMFSLSNDALKALNFNLYDKDFTFIVGKKQYNVSKIFADLISPNVNKMHRSDPTSCIYFIPKYDESKDDNYYKSFRSMTSHKHDDEEDYFKYILQLSEGNEIETNKINEKPILYYFNKLGNPEFLRFLLGSEKFQEINEDNAIDRLLIKISNSINAREELAYISSNLYEFDENILSTLDVETLSLILSQPCLRIQNEEWLFDFIMNNISENPSFISLFEYVEFCNLSVDKIFQFEETITLDDLNYTIWKSICKRLICEIVSTPSTRSLIKSRNKKYVSYLPKLKRKMIKFDDDLEENSNHNSFPVKHNGIISYLYSKNNGSNPSKGENKLINITVNSCELSNTIQSSAAILDAEINNLTASPSNSSLSDSFSLSESSQFSDDEQNDDEPINLNSVSNQHFEPENVADFESDTRYYSKDEPNQYIMFDFKDMRVNPTHYMIRTQGCGANCCHMKSWVCELSEDGTEWIEGDRQKDSSNLNGSFMVGVFPIKTEVPLKYRYIRIKQIGPNWFNDNRMIMCGVEFFGTLYE